MIQFVLSDIEGTTTDIQFVHATLFPYFAQQIANEWKHLQSWSEFPTALAEMSVDSQAKTDEEWIAQILHWVHTDVKQAGMKRLQGKVWETAYISGAIQGHVYADVPQAFKRWKAAGIGIGIYSSGSVYAQKLLLQYSNSGNLDSYITANFDTAVGHKRETQSYIEISKQLNIKPKNILFLSDIKEELDAAHAAGFSVGLSIRSGNAPQAAHTYAHIFSFDEVDNLFHQVG